MLKMRLNFRRLVHFIAYICVFFPPPLVVAQFILLLDLHQCLDQPQVLKKKVGLPQLQPFLLYT
uniref:Uncharacterized protein n=1 Tax=Lotus japonicus TaxID=34305 RepID=I3S5R2_LOTJA|nr:unknown [Lotus japonicus]